MATRPLTLALAFAGAAGQLPGLLGEGEPSLISDAETCPGSINMGGVGAVQVVATKWNVPDDPAAKVDVEDGMVLPNLKGRAYFAEACTPGQYNYKEYLAPDLLGKVFHFTTNLSAAGCGCNVALYLTNLQQNPEFSGCKDYYCDANSVCGVMCPEIDIMEANSIAWHSTLHAADDKFGIGGGYGGGGPGWNGARDWTREQYGPGGKCIDTNYPFEVRAAFPVDRGGMLEAMIMTLSQEGKDCDLTKELRGYDGNTTKHPKGGKEGMVQLTEALRKGMTPIASLWQSKDMLWMDGKGDDGLGPCEKDLVEKCPNRVPMYNFSIEELPPPSSWFMRPELLIVALLALPAGGAILCCLGGRSGSRRFEDSESSSESD